MPSSAISRRARQPDTEADRQIRACVIGDALRSFSVTAGAGSGKTTSLVKVLSAIVDEHGLAMAKRKQRVACITYTEVASAEIWGDVGNSPLAHVATTHSFFWAFLRPLQRDIASWARTHTSAKIAETVKELASIGPKAHATRARLQADLDRYKRRAEILKSITSFTYGVGSDLDRGVLGHDDVISCASWLFAERPVSRTLMAQQYPFILVDESQDTFPAVVEALKRIEEHVRGKICIGFFGDPMQKIYAQGIGEIALEPHWVRITKRENFRCADSVLAVANAIRRQGDGIQQEPGERDPAKRRDGAVAVYVLPADENRTRWLERVRLHMADYARDAEWRTVWPSGARALVLVHRVAAKRLGFENLYAAFNDKAPEAMKAGLLDGSAWQLRPFLSCALPICKALDGGDEFGLMNVLRDQAPQLRSETDERKRISEVLKELRCAAEALRDMMAPGSASSVGDVLRHIAAAPLAKLDERFSGFIGNGSPRPTKATAEDEDKLQVSMQRFLDTRAAELRGFDSYLRGESPFSTQQGIKGAEFPRVLIVIDEEEGTHNQFSYEKLLGLKPLSDRDRENESKGVDSVLDRTRRLLYVSCTRALNQLAIVIFVGDPLSAKPVIEKTGLFPGAQFVSAEDLKAFD